MPPPLTKIGIILNSSFAGGKDLFSDMQIKETGSFEREICTEIYGKNLKGEKEKTKEKKKPAKPEDVLTFSSLKILISSAFPSKKGIKRNAIGKEACFNIASVLLVDCG